MTTAPRHMPVKDQPAADLLRDAQDLDARGRIDGAWGYYLRIIKDHPNSDEARIAAEKGKALLIRSAQETESLRKAEKDYDYYRNSAKALDYYSSLVHSFPESEEAKAAAERIKVLGPEVAKQELRNAQRYESERDIDLVIFVYGRVIEADPNSNEARIAAERIKALGRKK